MRDVLTKRLATACVVCAAALVLIPATAAKDGDVLVQGTCTGATTSKLKLSEEDGRIEVEFEVDQNRVGRRWRVTIVQNGRTVFSGIRRTLAPSGSFEARRMLANRPGADRIVARARALAGGETCRGALSY